jgi:hypothetical protein
MPVDFGPFQRPDPLPADNGPGLAICWCWRVQLAEMILPPCVWLRRDRWRYSCLQDLSRPSHPLTLLRARRERPDRTEQSVSSRTNIPPVCLRLQYCFARRGLRGVKLVISDAHEGIKAAVAKMLHACCQRCRVHFMRNVLAHAGRQGRRVVSAFIGTAFVQDDAEAARTQWRQVADQLSPKVPNLATLMDEAEAGAIYEPGNDRPVERWSDRQAASRDRLIAGPALPGITTAKQIRMSLSKRKSEKTGQTLSWSISSVTPEQAMDELERRL